MGIAWIGEFLGTAYASYSTTKTKLDIADKSKDFCPDETKLFIMKSLGDCAPASDHLTKLGRFNRFIYSIGQSTRDMYFCFKNGREMYLLW